MIIQGDNKPIVLEFDESIVNIEYFSAILYGKKGNINLGMKIRW